MQMSLSSWLCSCQPSRNQCDMDQHVMSRHFRTRSVRRHCTATLAVGRDAPRVSVDLTCHREHDLAAGYPGPVCNRSMCLRWCTWTHSPIEPQTCQDKLRPLLQGLLAKWMDTVRLDWTRASFRTQAGNVLAFSGYVQWIWGLPGIGPGQSDQYP